MILADKITEERKKNGWSQEELANQLGVSRQAVSKWESAGAVPDLQRILQMSELRQWQKMAYFMFQNLWQQYLDVFFCLEWLQQPSFCLLHMECVNHIWNILKKNALKQSMVYLEWYEKKKISMNRFLSEEQLLG